MSLCNAAVTDPICLGKVSANCSRPSNEQHVRVISNGLHASEAQGSTSGGELGMAITSEEAACGKKANRKSVPYKGRRERHKHIMERLKNDVTTAPHLMDAQSVAWPPSLRNDVQKKQWLGEVSTTRDSPSNKQNVRVIGNGLHASEAQDSTSGSELGPVITSEESACGEKAKRKNRAQGRRERRRRFKEQLKNAVLTAPHLMDAHSVAWPPSFQNAEKQQLLMTQLTMCKLQQLKIQGEPCMIDPALKCSYPSEMPR